MSFALFEKYLDEKFPDVDIRSVPDIYNLMRDAFDAGWEARERASTAPPRA